MKHAARFTTLMGLVSARDLSHARRRIGPWTYGVALLAAAASLAWIAGGPSAGSLLHAAAAQETDTDGDTMPDAWETFFGLNPNDPGDATADPDGDGLTNAQEFAARRHPVGRHTRYFAEGSTGFFDTSVGVLNLSTTDTAHVAIALLNEAGGAVSHQLTLGPRQRRTVSVNEVLAASAAVAIVVESDVAVAADRWMTWGTSGVGASLDSGAPTPATTWYFAEGATGPFLLYYLFENPGTTPANVTIRYLLEGGAAVETTHPLPPQSRTTIAVNQDDPALAVASVGSVITSDAPIFAERAMYVNAGGTLGGGSASAGSNQLSTQWYFGEGATGPFFHAFLALLNPGTEAATATVTYHLSDGSTASKAYDVPAAGRRTVYFNREAALDPALEALARGPVWFTISSTHPILGERAMWWPDWPWYEGHAAPGSTASGVSWAVPEGRHGGPTRELTYVLIGNTTATASQVRLTLIPDTGAPLTQELAIGAGERLTVNVGNLFGLSESRFSVVVESLGTPATPLAVDYARYRTANGIPFSGGGAAPAIPLPGPNVAPSFTPGPNQTVLEDAGPQAVAGWATAISPGPAAEGGQAVTFVVTGNTNAALFSTPPAISATGTLTYTPAANANGTATLTLVLRDDGGTANGGVDTSAPQELSITVTAVNDPPAAPTDADATANAVAENSPNGTPVGIRAIATDPDFDIVAFSLADDAGGRFQIDPVTGVVSVANGALLDFELATFHNITVAASDGSLQAAAPFRIDLSNLGPGPCVCTPLTFTNNTPLAIPAGPAVVTSTITVTGAGPVISDVNLTTFLTHTFAADLDVTITSPAGTVVTLTTDNGAGNDNVFNGTVWDDDANPAGQVPYTTNNGLVTDHAYVNLTLASPLAPEGALAAFNGENPNGTWTITVSDDLAGDGGSLDSWTLNLCTLPAAPAETTTSLTNSTPLGIPAGPAVVTSTLTVTGAGTQIGKVTLLTNLVHTFAADLDITITSPAGTVVTLTTDNGAGNDNVFNGTLWDDDANGRATDHGYVNLTTASPLVPEEALAAFIGEDPNGTWTITISDDLAGDGGSLDSWTLNITTITCETASLLAWGTGVRDFLLRDASTVESLTCGGARPSANDVVAPAGAPAEVDAEDELVNVEDLGPPDSTGHPVADRLRGEPVHRQPRPGRGRWARRRSRWMTAGRRTSAWTRRRRAWRAAGHSASFGTSSGKPGNSWPSSGFPSWNIRLCRYISSRDGSG
jgi:subtilisin-like proprotein convertase family protein